MKKSRGLSIRMNPNRSPNYRRFVQSPSIELEMIMETAGPGNVALMLPEGILLCLCAVHIKIGRGGTQEHRRVETTG